MSTFSPQTQSYGEHTGAPRRSARNRYPNASPIMNKDEHAVILQRKVQQPSFPRLIRRQAQLEFNDPGLHSPMASPRIFVLQRRVVEQLPSCISAFVHQQHRRKGYFCRQCVVNGNTGLGTSTDARLNSTEERNMQAEPLDRHCKHQYLRSILEAKLGARIFEQ